MFVGLGIFLTEGVEKIKIHILCSITLLKNRTICEKMWKNIIQPDRPQTTVWHMHFACWITMARIQTHRLCNMYRLSTATSYMFVPKYVTLTLPVLVCWSPIVRTTDNSKIILQAFAPCPVTTTICFVTMKV